MTLRLNTYRRASLSLAGLCFAASSCNPSGSQPLGAAGDFALSTDSMATAYKDVQSNADFNAALSTIAALRWSRIQQHAPETLTIDGFDLDALAAAPDETAKDLEALGSTDKTLGATMVKLGWATHAAISASELAGAVGVLKRAATNTDQPTKPEQLAVVKLFVASLASRGIKRGSSLALYTSADVISYDANNAVVHTQNFLDKAACFFSLRRNCGGRHGTAVVPRSQISCPSLDLAATPSPSASPASPSQGVCAAAPAAPTPAPTPGPSTGS